MLKIEHAISNEVIIYDICDIDGKILINGELASNSKETIIRLDELASGKYHLFLIYEGYIHKSLISI